MRFQVPQFIGIEDKVFGPFTVKQFVYMAGGAGICYVAYKFLPFLIAIIFMIPLGALALALAFVKVNNKPFIFTLEAAVKYFIGNKLYLWHKAEKKERENNKNGNNVNSATSLEASDFAPRLGESKLKEITWSLDINKNINDTNR